MDAFALLEPGGVFIGHSLNPSASQRAENISYQNKNKENGVYPGQIRIHLEYKNQRSSPWKLLLLFPEDVETILTSAGFQDIHFKHNGGSYYVIARK